MEYQTIVYGQTKYVLRGPEKFQVVDDQKGFALENEGLDLYASGRSLAEAQKDLFYQFDASYKRFAELDDSLLSPRMLAVKRYYQHIVLSIENK